MRLEEMGLLVTSRGMITNEKLSATELIPHLDALLCGLESSDPTMQLATVKTLSKFDLMLNLRPSLAYGLRGMVTT